MSTEVERRYRELWLAPSLLAEIVGMGTAKSTAVEQVSDLRIVDIKYDHWADQIKLLVSSESFEPVHEAALAPLWTPSFTRDDTETAMRIRLEELAENPPLSSDGIEPAIRNILAGRDRDDDGASEEPSADLVASSAVRPHR